ncbi:MAG: NADH-quinone oxidoreductase subunit NuoB [Oligoflexia bacterium]|nr:NADH-quinone oxidoreductase subunit NuoB [Oligoflexia bacterium]
MKSGAFYVSTVGKLLKWARANSLWYTTTGSSCCADEVLNAAGSRYDLERFGCIPQVDPRQADLLIVTGVVSYKVAPHLKAVYDAMPSPKHVLALGACANCGGMFAPEYSYSVVPGVDRIIPVDVYVPGCPPRPESIMNGLIALQEKINGNSRPHFKAQ